MSSKKTEETKNQAPEVTREGRAGTLGKLKTFSSLGNPLFRHYYVSSVCQQAAMNMQQITVALLAYRITGSATSLGVVALAGVLPHIVASLSGGAVADRIVKKYVILFGMLMFTLQSLSVAVCLTLGILNAHTWWILIINSVLQNVLMGILVPARQSIIREIVGSEGLMNAVSLNTMAASTLMLVAPAAAGFLIDAFNFEVVFYIMTGLYALGAVFMVFLPHKGKIVARVTESPLRNVVEGLKYISHEPNLLFVVIFFMFGVILTMPYQQLTAVFVDKILFVGGHAVGAKGMGIMRSVTGVGGLTTSLILASLPNKKRGFILLTGTLTFGLALIVFAFSKSWPLSLAIMFVVGIGQTMRQTAATTLLMHLSGEEFRGRIMGIQDAQMSFNGLGVYLAAVLADALGGPQWAVGGFAILITLISIMALLFSRRMRALQ